MKYQITTLLTILLLSGCTVIATKGNEVMTLKGFGAKSAKFSDVSEIYKNEPFQVPNILPIGR